MARIIDLTDIAAGLENADCLAVSDVSANQDKKLLISALRTFILGGKVLGGSGVGDVTVNNAVQTLTQKTLTSPKINSTAATAVTSEDLDKLHGVTVSAAVLNYMSGVSSNVQTQINNKANYTMVSRMPEYYNLNFTASADIYTISEATIRTAMGWGTDRRCSPALSLSLYQVGASYNTLLSPTLKVYPGIGGVLDHLDLSSLSIGTNYMVVIICFDVAIGGGT